MIYTCIACEVSLYHALHVHFSIVTVLYVEHNTYCKQRAPAVLVSTVNGLAATDFSAVLINRVLQGGQEANTFSCSLYTAETLQAHKL